MTEQAGQLAFFSYSHPLEHLEDRLRRATQIIAARAIQTRKRRFRHNDDEISVVDMSARANDRIPKATKALWKQADYTLTMIRSREAVTTKLDLPLVRIAKAFELSPVEEDILALLAVSRIDARRRDEWENEVGIDFDRPAIGDIIALLARSFEESVAMRKLFSIEGKLFKHALVRVQDPDDRVLLDLRLLLPERIIGELLGEHHVVPEMMTFLTHRRPNVALEQVILPEAAKELVLSLVRDHDKVLERRREWGLDEVVTYGRGLNLLFAGPPGTGKTMLAHAVANATKKPLFSVDLAKLMDEGSSIQSSLETIFREARLLDAVLFFDECEQLFAARRYGNDAMAVLLTRLEHFDGIAILATNMEHVLDEALSRRILARVDFRPPTREERLEIWKRHLPETLPLGDDVDLEALAEQWELSGGTIKNAVLAGVSRAISGGCAHVSQGDLEYGAKLQIRFDGDDSRRVVEPEAKLEDVVLPSEIRNRLERFVAAARARSTALVDWGFARTLGRGTGLCALLSGPSGTGKSMTAEAIATALGRPLLRCHLPDIISPYVGQTAQNIDKLFTMAREHRAVLVFDEADALFAKRVEVRSANDRFVNAETGALLTQIERHDGVVILTTNLAVDLDAAFERRLQLRLDFPLPDASSRAAIWRRLLSADAPIDNDVDATKLGRQFELSGGMIRNAVLTAALEASSAPPGERRITRAMLERAASEQAGSRTLPVSFELPTGDVN